MTLNHLVQALSVALDFTSNGISEHHRRVAYLALRIGRAMGLSPSQQRELYFAASLHDIGAIAFNEKSKLAQFDVDAPFPHCERGYAFVSDSELFSSLGPIIVAHHDRFEGGNRSGLAGDEIPLLARIIHLADRIDILADRRGYILAQRSAIVRALSAGVGSAFDPDVYQAFCDVSASESFWLDFSAEHLGAVLDALSRDWNEPVAGSASTLEVARIFAKVIDSKSRYTMRHSASVASVAVRIGERMGLDEEARDALATAALLHDIGKLSVPEAILDKPGRLTDDEFAIIKQHPYHTFYILDPIEGFDEIKRWAAYHHERIDGRGYPFRVGGSELPQGARILAVADVFAALAEDRPYRPGMSREMIEKIIGENVASGGLSAQIAEVVLDDFIEFKRLTRVARTAFPEFVKARLSSQRAAATRQQSLAGGGPGATFASATMRAAASGAV